MGIFTKGNKSPEMEGPYETGMDEQAKQSAMSSNEEGVDEKSKRDDRSEDYYDTLRLERLHQKIKLESLELAEREQALVERKNRESEYTTLKANREYSTHMLNLKAAEHYRHGYDKLQNLEVSEAKAQSEVLTGYDLQAVRAAVDVAVAQALAAINKKQ